MSLSFSPCPCFVLPPWLSKHIQQIPVTSQQRPGHCRVSKAKCAVAHVRAKKMVASPMIRSHISRPSCGRTLYLRRLADDRSSSPIKHFLRHRSCWRGARNRIIIYNIHLEYEKRRDIYITSRKTGEKHGGRESEKKSTAA
jgi:hypothetical protein